MLKIKPVTTENCYLSNFYEKFFKKDHIYRESWLIDRDRDRGRDRDKDRDRDRDRDKDRDRD